MKLAFKIFFLVVILVGYVFFINFLASIFSFPFENFSASKTVSDSGIVQISVGNSVSVQVVRNRIYGKIVVNDGRETLYLGGLIKLPKKVDNLNFMWYHLVFLIFFIALSILILIPKQKIYKGKNIELNNWRNYNERDI